MKPAGSVSHSRQAADGRQWNSSQMRPTMNSSGSGPSPSSARWSGQESLFFFRCAVRQRQIQDGAEQEVRRLFVQVVQNGRRDRFAVRPRFDAFRQDG